MDRDPIWLAGHRVRNNRRASVEKVELRNRSLSARFTARLRAGAHRYRILVPQTPGYVRCTSRFVRFVR